MREYFIEKFCKINCGTHIVEDWCLERLCGTKKEKAEIVLEELRKEFPDALFRIDSEESEKCWWNQGGLD